jgi:mannose/fructose-specific phosphotransferase system component IIA
MDAVEKMLGPQTGVDVLSNEGMSLQQIVEAVESRLGDAPSVLFVDHCGGSPFVACKALHSRHPQHALLTGVNLPMLLSFFTKRAGLAFEELVPAVESDGHRGIQRIPA